MTRDKNDCIIDLEENLQLDLKKNKHIMNKKRKIIEGSFYIYRGKSIRDYQVMK